MTGRRFIFSLLRWTGLPLLVRELYQRDRTTIVFYHDVGAEALDAHLSALGPRYRFTTLREFVEAGGPSKLPPRSLVVTVDDGLRGNRELLEVFRRHGVTPTLFIATGIVGTSRRFWTSVPGDPAEVERLKRVSDGERLAALADAGFEETGEAEERTALSREEIEEMAGAVDLQPHTVFHPILARCTDERARAEIFGSKEQLEREYGIDVYAFAYPNGTASDFTDRDVRLVAEAGYRCAVTTEPGANAVGADPFRLKRIGLNDQASATEAIVQASGLSAWLRRLFVRG